MAGPKVVLLSRDHCIYDKNVSRLTLYVQPDLPGDRLGPEPVVRLAEVDPRVVPGDGGEGQGEAADALLAGREVAVLKGREKYVKMLPEAVTGFYSAIVGG